MSDVKLTREGLTRAIAQVELNAGVYGPVKVVLDAARALLAATEPASDEEVGAWMDEGGGERFEAWRAAEARARRLAFGEEG